MAAASPPAIANAPQGHQVGFIMNKGSMSYSVYLDADTYNLSFLAAQRANHQTQSQQIEVLVDGTQVGLITPSGTSYTSLRDVEFHGRGRNAYHRVPGHESGQRREHRLDRPGGPRGGGKHVQRRRFRVAGPGGEDLPGRAQRFRLAVLGRSPA